MRRPAVLAGIVIACAVAPASAKPAPYVLQPGHIDLARGPDGNTVILDAPQGLVVVDTGRHPEHVRAILDHARQVGKPIVAVVNTHWHLDHTTGNRDVLAAYPRAAIVSSMAVEGALDGFLARSKAQTETALAGNKLTPEERARAERALAAVSDRRALVPTLPVTWNGPIVLGGRRFEARLARNAATQGDVWLLVPDEQLAIAGDLVVAPVPFFDTGCEEGWAKALGAIAAAKWTTLIPGHGAPMTRADFTRWRSAFTSYVDCARSRREAADCARGWQRDATGFYTAGEADSVRRLAVYYVDNVLRAPPEKRMAYCRVES